MLLSIFASSCSYCYALLRLFSEPNFIGSRLADQAKLRLDD